MRGLTQFIGDIRNCANKEEERKRVDKEMANIRKHFKTAVKLTPCVPAPDQPAETRRARAARRSCAPRKIAARRVLSGPVRASAPLMTALPPRMALCFL
jgi:hypothetical protein